MWTTHRKMTKPEWEMHVPAFRRAVVDGGCTYGRHRAKVWHDNEMFLLCPDAYRREGLEQRCFPPNSGDLNPIGIVWARPRKDLAAREHEDLRQEKVLTFAQFELRVDQILQSYSIIRTGESRILIKVTIMSFKCLRMLRQRRIARQHMW